MTILEVAVVCKSNSGGFSITAFYFPNHWHLVYSLHILALNWAGSELSNRTMVAWPTSQLCVLWVAILVSRWPPLLSVPSWGLLSSPETLSLPRHEVPLYLSCLPDRLISSLFTNQKMENSGPQNAESGNAPVLFHLQPLA